MREDSKKTEEESPGGGEKLDPSVNRLETREINERNAPPPPRDWVSLPVTRAALILLVVVFGVLIGLYGKAWYTYLRENPVFAIILLIAAFLIIGFATAAYLRASTFRDSEEVDWGGE